MRAGVPNNCPSGPDQPGMPSEETTLAEFLKKADYATALIGKWHLGTKAENQPNAQGFDTFFGHLAGCIDYWSHMFYYQKDAVPHHDLHQDRMEVFEYGQSMTDLIAREAIQFIDQNRDKAFFLFVPFNAPHYPMQAPRRLTDPYRHLPAARMEYAGHVAHLDEVVGKVVDRLRSLQLLDRTAILFMSDNGHSVEARCGFGGGSSGPHRGHKFSLFEGGIRTPLIMSCPDLLPKGQTRDQIGIAMDIFPTVADLVGIPIPSDGKVDGRSLAPILKSNCPSAHTTLHWQFGKQGAVRSGKWKLVVSPQQESPKVELPDIFLADIEKDPGETANLAGQYPDVVRQLTGQHEVWLADVKRR